MSELLTALGWLAFVVRLLLELAMLGVALGVVRPSAPRAGYILAAGAALALLGTCSCRIWSRFLRRPLIERELVSFDTAFLASSCASTLEYVLVIALVLLGLASLARVVRAKREGDPTAP